MSSPHSTSAPYNPLTGYLGWESFPLHDPVILSAFVGTLLAGIAALYLQDRYGWRAGKVQMAVDCCIVLLALWTVEPLRVAWSIAGAVALNLVLAMNHRPGRYMAV